MLTTTKHTNKIWAPLISGAILTILAYLFLDQPIAYFVSNWQMPLKIIFQEFTQIEQPLYYLALILTLVAMLLTNRKFLSNYKSFLVSAGFSMVTAYSITRFLKLVFGRFWPETWVNNNPSLISNHAFGFNFLHGGADYASFPSGHMTIMCALTTVLCIFYPRLKILWVLLALFMAISLLILDYHFLSDIIAGSTVGMITALLINSHLNKPATLATYNQR